MLLFAVLLLRLGFLMDQWSGVAEITGLHVLKGLCEKNEVDITW